MILRRGLLDLVVEMAAILDELGVPYALGGSMASSLLGEPRSTMDVDLAVRLDETSGAALIERVAPSFHVPLESARAAIRECSSFNLLDSSSALKVDLFVVGDGLLDRLQIERRVRTPVPGAPSGVWVTAPEEQVLRKLDWLRLGGSVSDHQWRDVIGILRIHRDRMDVDHLDRVAAELGLGADLAEALRQAQPDSG